MIINGSSLLELAPIKDMLDFKALSEGTSYGLSEAGYDIRLKQEIIFSPGRYMEDDHIIIDGLSSRGSRFTLASAMEEFQMPVNLIGRVHDKSTWARHGLSVFNTVIEPGWRGFLTLELVFNTRQVVHLPAGCGIAQVIFDEIKHPASYQGKYQNQEDKPTEPILR